MGYIAASVKTGDGLDILKAIKNILKTGWTLDEENEILWKDSPAAFPVGLGVSTVGSNKYIAPVVKNGAGEVKYGSSYAYAAISASALEYYIYLFTSPNGSIAISVSNSVSEQRPIFTFVKNGTTEPTLPTYIPAAYGNATSNTLQCFIPGTNESASFASPENVFRGLNMALCNAVDPYTGTAFSDLYFLAATAGDPPRVLAYGSQRFIQFRTMGNAAKIFYLRYV